MYSAIQNSISISISISSAWALALTFTLGLSLGLDPIGNQNRYFGIHGGIHLGINLVIFGWVDGMMTRKNSVHVICLGLGRFEVIRLRFDDCVLLRAKSKDKVG